MLFGLLSYSSKRCKDAEIVNLAEAMTDHNKNNDDLEFEMVFNHHEDKHSFTFKDSCEFVDTAIEDATNNKVIKYDKLHDSRQ